MCLAPLSQPQCCCKLTALPTCLPCLPCLPRTACRAPHHLVDLRQREAALVTMVVLAEDLLKLHRGGNAAQFGCKASGMQAQLQNTTCDAFHLRCALAAFFCMPLGGNHNALEGGSEAHRVEAYWRPKGSANWTTSPSVAQTVPQCRRSRCRCRACRGGCSSSVIITDTQREQKSICTPFSLSRCSLHRKLCSCATCT